MSDTAATAEVTTTTPADLVASVGAGTGTAAQPYQPFTIKIEHGASPKLLKTILIVLAVMGGVKLLLMLISFAFVKK